MIDTKPTLINGNMEQLSTLAQPTPMPGMVPSQQLPANSMENGLPLAATAEDVKERGPPKALIHPQVLTHVIEDFVIQESSEPFPITRSSLLSDMKSSPTSTDKDDEQSRKLTKRRMFLVGFGSLVVSGKRRLDSSTSNVVGVTPKGELAKCDACGTVDLRAKFKKNKRFCSVSCSKK